MPVACAATAANVNDTLVFERLFLTAFAVMARIHAIFADRGYDVEHHRALCRAFGAEPQIHKRGRLRGSGLGGRRWPVERSNAWVLENRRLALRYDRLGFVVQSLLQSACIVLGRKIHEAGRGLWTCRGSLACRLCGRAWAAPASVPWRAAIRMRTRIASGSCWDPG